MKVTTPAASMRLGTWFTHNNCFCDVDAGIEYSYDVTTDYPVISTRDATTKHRLTKPLYCAVACVSYRVGKNRSARKGLDGV